MSVPTLLDSHEDMQQHCSRAPAPQTGYVMTCVVYMAISHMSLALHDLSPPHTHTHTDYTEEFFELTLVVVLVVMVVSQYPDSRSEAGQSWEGSLETPGLPRHENIFPWTLPTGCGHCKKMKPEFEGAAEVLHGDAEVSFLSRSLTIPSNGLLAPGVVVTFYKP